MKIQNNNFNINFSSINHDTNAQTVSNSMTSTSMGLPAVNTIGASLVNSNMPISYTKIAEITIPNMEEKASVFKLANGQKVVILPKKGPAFIKTTFNVGSLNETENIRGISHFIEHNLFNGSKGLTPTEYKKRVYESGAYTNATTSYDKTDYYIALQLLDDNSLENAIKLNAIQTQFPTFPPDQIEKEKGPVNSEIDVYLDNISDVASSKMLKNLFGVNTNSTNFILGTHDNINGFTQDKLFDYFNTWYTPDNAVTVITGDVDVNETIKLVSKYYNKQGDYSRIQNRHYEPIKYIDKPIREDIIQKGSPVSEISLGFAIKEGTSKRDLCAIDLLKKILTSPESRLSKALEKYGIKPSFAIESMQNKKDGAKALYTSITLPEDKVEEVLKILYEEINYIANNPPSFTEFANAQNSLIDSVNNIGEYSEDINAVLTSACQYGEYDYIQSLMQNYQTLTPYEITSAAKKFMDLTKASICVAHADNTPMQTINNNYNAQKTKQISFGKASTNTDIKAQEYKLGNNIETIVVNGNMAGKSALCMSIEADTLKSAPESALYILSEMLNRGSAIRGYDNYNSELCSKNLLLKFSVGTDGISVISKFNDDKIQDTLSLIKEVLNSPNFNEGDFEQIKSNYRDILLTRNKSASTSLLKSIFPDIHYFDTVEEQLKELDKLTLNDIRNLYAQIMNNSQCEVTYTAPVDKKPYLTDILNSQLSQGMGVFQNAIVNRSQNTHVYKPNTEPKIIAQAEDNMQAQIVQGYIYPRTYNIEDKAKIMLLNIILGGSMSSRLFNDLREAQKLAYSVNSSLLEQNDAGVIMLHIGTTTDSQTPGEETFDNAAKAISGFNKNVELLKSESVTAQELDYAKKILKTDLLNSIESNIGLTTQFHENRNSAYGTKEFELFLNAIDKVSIEDIKAAANYVFQNQPITSIVASQKTLKALNLQ